MNINKSLIITLENSLYNVHKKLIIDICNDLNKSDKIDFLINKYLKQKKKNNDNDLLNISNIKRNKSSYLFFTEEVRPKLRSKFPNDNMSQISKRLGKLWSSLTNKDKKKYEKKALIDKERYLSEINKKVEHSLNSSNEELLAEEEYDEDSNLDDEDSNLSQSNKSSEELEESMSEEVSQSNECSSELISEDSSNIITKCESDKSSN
jgi:hypothetical protein